VSVCCDLVTELQRVKRQKCRNQEKLIYFRSYWLLFIGETTLLTRWRKTGKGLHALTYGVVSFPEINIKGNFWKD